MDVLSFIFSEENVRTLILLVAIFAAKISVEKSLRKEMDERFAALERKMDGLGVSLRQEMNAMTASLRREMDERFVAFHKMLKENDFAHLHQAIKALTFALMKNGTLDPKDKEYIDSQLDG